MKKILLFASALAGLFFAASCQQENLEPVGGNTVTITVEAPGAINTKAIADGTNVNEVHYAVYKTNSGEDYSIDDSGAIDGPLAQGVVPMSNKRASIEFDLLQDQEFTVIFWAQVAGASHYELGDLRTISINDAVVDGNDETRAAFFARYDFSTEEHKDHKVTLRRPFAQLNLLTTPESLTPVQQGQTTGYTIDVQTSEVKVIGLGTAFNTLDGVAPAADETLVYEMAATPAKQGQTTLSVNGKDYHYVSMNYLFVPEEEKLVDIEYSVATDKGNIAHEILAVPVKENYRTNVIGNLLTKETTFEIIVDAEFDGSIVGHSIWDGQTITEPAVDAAAAEPTYLISSADELAWLAAAVNGTLPSAAAPETFSGCKVLLTADIDLNCEHWTPIGYWQTFNGTFDGQGYTISNLKHHGTEEDCYVGLFGYTENATIKNLTINNVDIKLVANSSWAGGHMGALVGNLEGKTLIENITVTGDVKIEGDLTKDGAGRIGAVVGGNMCDATLKNVSVVANDGSYVMGNSIVGGIAGQLQGVTVFENCSSNIDVTAQKFYAGGIIGLAAAKTSFTNCSTSGDISVLAGRTGNANDLYRVGGIAGGWGDNTTYPLTLVNCSYTGKLFGQSADGTVASAFDCAGFVGRGYVTEVGAKVIVNGAEYVYQGNGVYALGDALLVSNAAAFQAALDAKAEHIVLLPGTYKGTFALKADNTVIEGQEGAVVACVNLNGAKNTTIKNVEFDAAEAKLGYDRKGNAKQYANIITGDKTNNPLAGAHGVVIDGCKFTGTFVNAGASIAFADYYRTSGFSGNVTIKNCTFDTQNAYYNIYGHYCGNGTNGFGEFVIENNTFNTTFTAGGAIYLGRYASSVPVVVKDNTFNVAKSLDEAMYVQDHSNYGVSINATNNTFAL